MSVNIFGAGRIAPRISENIGEKFKTLSLNLASKLDKSGGVMTGDLLLNSSELRTFGVRDISSGQSTSLLLGDVENQFRYNYGLPLKIAAAHGLKIICPGGEICALGSHTDANLIMNNNHIKKLHDPEDSQDAATKYYVDNKQSVIGYVPALEANISRLGFSASASGVSNPRHQPFGAFNNLNADGANGSWVTPNTTGWLQIKCPERVKIWRIALKARKIDGRDITAWYLSASIDGTSFTTLINSTIALLGFATAPTFIDIPTNNAYQYYRLNITASTGSADVGIQMFQLYIMD
jgi:hypothetical protein